MVVAFYYITWEVGKMVGKHRHQHELVLAPDVHEALQGHYADAVLLSECGQVGVGLEDYDWSAII